MTILYRWHERLSVNKERPSIIRETFNNLSLFVSFAKEPYKRDYIKERPSIIKTELASRDQIFDTSKGRVLLVSKDGAGSEVAVFAPPNRSLCMYDSTFVYT